MTVRGLPDRATGLKLLGQEPGVAIFTPENMTGIILLEAVAAIGRAINQLSNVESGDGEATRAVIEYLRETSGRADALRFTR